jgi:hypothetical protein
MTRLPRSSARARISALAAVTALGALAISGLGAEAARPPAGAAAAKGFKSKLTYDETNHGHPQGTATVGVQGHGSFSAKLSPHAALEAALIAMATGVPVTKIAQGGSYKVQRDFLASGGATGLAVVKFKAHGLGSLCVSFTQHAGKYVPGSSFIPSSGTLKSEGGTGAAARWRGALSYDQTSVSGSSVENFGFTGSEHASVGKAKPMSSACKRVAAIQP